MAEIVTQNPGSTEVQSPLIAGITEGLNKLSQVLNLETETMQDIGLTAVEIDTQLENKNRIFEAAMDKKLWLRSPEVIVKKDGVTIKPQDIPYSIDYIGGSVTFDSPLQDGEIVTVTATHVVANSTTINAITDLLNEVSNRSQRYKGYFDNLETLENRHSEGKPGDIAFVEDPQFALYSWDSQQSKWRNTQSIEDLSKYYTSEQVDKKLSGKEDSVSASGKAKDYYGGDKKWHDVDKTVIDTKLTGFNTNENKAVTEADNILVAAGKLQAQANEAKSHDYLSGSGAPTTGTVGNIGQRYVNTSTGDWYTCTAKGENTYTWEKGTSDKKVSDHISNKSNPHNVTAEQVGAYKKSETYNQTQVNEKASGVQNNLDNHVKNKENPHGVTAEQIKAVKAEIYEDELTGSTVKNGAIVTANLTKDTPLHVVSTITPKGGGGTPDAPIPIVGYDAVNTTVCGENLCKPQFYTGGQGLMWEYVGSEYHGKGTTTNVFSIISPLKIPKGQYEAVISKTISYDIEIGVVDGKGGFSRYYIRAGATRVKIAVVGYDAEGKSGTLSLVGLKSSTPIDVSFGFGVFPVGSNFTPYIGTTYTQPFGHTVYGGQYDWQSGVLIVTHKFMELTGEEGWFKGTSSAKDFGRYYLKYMRGELKEGSKPLCNGYPSSNETGYSNSGKSSICKVDQSKTVDFSIALSEISDGTAWVNFLKQRFADGNPFTVCYELNTPITIKFKPTEMLSLEGTSNAFSDTGDTSVERQRNFNDHFAPRTELVGNTTLTGDIVTCNPLPTTPLHVVSKIELQGGGGTPEKPVPIRTVNKLGLSLSVTDGNLLKTQPKRAYKSTGLPFGEATLLKKGRYTLKWNVEGAKKWRFIFCLRDVNGDVITDATTPTAHLKGIGSFWNYNETYGTYLTPLDVSSVSCTFEIDADYWLNVGFYFGDTTEATVADSAMLVHRENAAEYTPYIGNTYTADFGQEVAQGEYDWNTGELRHPVFREYDGSENWELVNHVFMLRNEFEKSVGLNHPTNGVSSHLPVIGTYAGECTYVTGGDIYIGKGAVTKWWGDSAEGLAKFKSDIAKTHFQISGLLNTETTHLTPVAPSAVVGENNIFASAGTVDVSVYHGAQMDLLWENAAPTTAFPGQVVSLKHSLLDYQSVLIEFKRTTDDEFVFSNLFRSKLLIESRCYVFTAAPPDFYRRFFGRRTLDNATKLEFGEGISDSSSTTVPPASVCIPIRIYGIK